METNINKNSFWLLDPSTNSTIGPLRKDQLFVNGLAAGTSVKTSENGKWGKAYLTPELQTMFSKEEIDGCENRKTKSPFSFFADNLDYLLWGVVAVFVGFLLYLAAKYDALLDVAYGVGVIACMVGLYFVIKALDSNKMLATVVVVSAAFMCWIAIQYGAVSALIYIAGLLVAMGVLYFVCKLLDTNDKVKQVIFILVAIVLFLILFPIILAIVVTYLICKLLDLNDIVAGVTLLSVPVLTAVIFVVSGGLETVINALVFVVQTPALLIAKALMLFFIAIGIAILFYPAIYFYQCAKDRL